MGRLRLGGGDERREAGDVAARAGGGAEAAIARWCALVAMHEALTHRGDDAAQDREQGNAAEQASHDWNPSLTAPHERARLSSTCT